MSLDSITKPSSTLHKLSDCSPKEEFMFDKSMQAGKYPIFSTILLGPKTLCFVCFEFGADGMWNFLSMEF